MSTFEHIDSTDTTGPSAYWTRFRYLRYVPALFGLTWRTSARYATAVVLLRVTRAVLPVAMLWVAKAIIDGVVAATRGGLSPHVMWYVGLEVVLAVVSEVLARSSTLVETLLGHLLTDDVSAKLMEHGARLDLEDYENATVYDRLERARACTANDVGPLSQLWTLAQDAVTLVGLCGIVFSYSIWLGLLLVFAMIPLFVGEVHFSVLDYRFTLRTTEDARFLVYWRHVAATDRFAKEVRTLELGPWLVRRHRRLASRIYRERAALARRKKNVTVALSIVGVAGYYVAYILIVRAALRGEISIGYLTMLAASFSRMRDLVLHLLTAAGELHDKSLYLQDLFAFFEMQPRVEAAGGTECVRLPVQEGIVFDDVSFRYAGSDRWAIQHVSFRLDPGDCLALVGENGAGKSTIVKLLTRLYLPTEGRILLDGRDIRDYDLTALRRAISVLFQDFVPYNMCFDENIGIGALEEAAEYLDAVDLATSPSAPVPEAILRASEQSLAASIASRLPKGYRQMLGGWFQGGVGLSGGEWQRVALARTYLRLDSAQLLVLDEPTAALDARAEASIFEQFRALVKRRASVIISHRFSTVRMADRIIVLEKGSITETGNHIELIERRGLYADLFELQAAGYH